MSRTDNVIARHGEAAWDWADKVQAVLDASPFESFTFSEAGRKAKVTTEQARVGLVILVDNGAAYNVAGNGRWAHWTTTREITTAERFSYQDSVLGR